MDDQITAILIAVIAATPGAIVAYAALRATKTTHKLVNSRMDEMLALTTKTATEDERERVRQENGTR